MHSSKQTLCSVSFFGYYQPEKIMTVDVKFVVMIELKLAAIRFRTAKPRTNGMLTFLEGHTHCPVEQTRFPP